MSGDPFDAQGEAHEALGTAVASYGTRVLSDPRILGNLVTDLLPDSPRERSLLVTAAEAGVAADLAQHVDQQNLDVDTAIALVARGLTERRSIDLAASTWVATEYAQALGYQVRSATPHGQFADAPTPTATVRRPQASPVAAPFPAPAPPAGQSPGMPPQSPGTAPLFPQSPRPVQSPGTAPLFPPGPAGPQVPQSPAAPPMPFQQPGYQQPGYQQPSGPPPAGPQSPYQQPSSPPPSPPSPSGYPGPSYQSPGGQPQAPYQPPSGPTSPPPLYQQPPQPQPGFQTPYQPSGTPAWQGGVTQPAIVGRKSRKGLLFGGIGGGAVVIIAVVAIVLATSSRGTKPGPAAGTTHPVVTHSSSAAPTSPPAVLPAGITPLNKLLPSDISDTQTDCQAQTPKDLPFKVYGLVSAFTCSDPGLPGGQVAAFQSDSAADYEATWKSFNNKVGFDASSPSSSTQCPPAGSGPDIQGKAGWSNSTYPARDGQVVECFHVLASGTSTAASNLQPEYAWTLPTQYAFFIGQGAAGSSFSALQTWWSSTG